MAPFTLIHVILILAAAEAQNLILQFNPSFINAVRSFQRCKPLVVVDPLGISVLSQPQPGAEGAIATPAMPLLVTGLSLCYLGFSYFFSL